MKKLYLVCGTPGSGKSAWIAKQMKETIEEEAEEIMRAFGIALGEARAEWCERVLAGEDVPMFIDEEQTKVI